MVMFVMLYGFFPFNTGNDEAKLKRLIQVRMTYHDVDMTADPDVHADDKGDVDVYVYAWSSCVILVGCPIHIALNHNSNINMDNNTNIISTLY